MTELQTKILDYLNDNKGKIDSHFLYECFTTQLHSPTAISVALNSLVAGEFVIKTEIRRGLTFYELKNEES